MTSFIISGTSQTLREEAIQKLCTQFSIRKFDITRISREVSDEKNVKHSIGIDTIKKMHAKIFLKPLHSLMKAIIIDEAELLTVEAQNALLKVLEEPPAATILILSTTSSELLLPTIQSRCKIISLQEEASTLSLDEKQELLQFVQTTVAFSIGQALTRAETLSKDKQQTLVWLEKLIRVSRELLLTQAANDSEQAQILLNLSKQSQKLYTVIKTTNVNLRLALENFFLTFIQ